MDFFACHLFKGCDNSLVIGNSSLEKDVIAHPFLANHLLNVVVHYGIGQSAQKVVLLYSLLLEGIQVRFHENRTSIAQTGRLFSLQGHFSEFLNDVDIQLFIKFISDITGLNLVIDNRVKGKVTFFSPAGISVKGLKTSTSMNCGSSLVNTWTTEFWSG